ncbi:MAG: PEGA domain-containing protein [Candidatus Niyogibacteria bacterium]|nr:MAG: PEGA domain-containing protein [Candidatus Niyogibacteria bacterium]
MTLKNRRKLFWLSTLVFLIIAPPIVFYTTGWRLTSDLTIKRIGGLFIAVPEAGAEVYLNGKFVKNTNFLQSGVFIQDLTPGTYSVAVSKDGFWPWTKKLIVTESAVAEAKAFMLPQNINGKMLLNGPFESLLASNDNSLLLLEEKKGDAYTLTFYLPAENEFLSPATSVSKKLLTSESPLKIVSWKKGSAEVFFDNKTLSLTFDFSKRSVSAKKISAKLDDALAEPDSASALDYRQKAEMRYDNKNVWVNWLATPLPYFLSSSDELVFETKSQIRGASFFPKRSDLAVIAFANGIFASEIDGRGSRNIQPIYKGKNPQFTVLNNKIYILDQGVLALMEL